LSALIGLQLTQAALLRPQWAKTLASHPASPTPQQPVQVVVPQTPQSQMLLPAAHVPHWEPPAPQCTLFWAS
jgi:hypothetical protein